MWFKNLVIYRINQPSTLAPEAIASQIAERAARPCGGLEAFTFGFGPPLGRQGQDLVLAANGRILVCARREERLLPPAVVREVLDERVYELESNEGRPVRGKERRRMREDIYYELLPKAFTRTAQTFAYLNPDRRWLAIDSASPTRAEELMNLLCHCVHELEVEPLAVRLPALAMTEWLSTGRLPEGFSIEDECELREPREDGAIVRLQREDLTSREVRNHLDAGKQVQRLALNFAERLSLVLAADLTVRRIKFLAVEELDEHDELDEAARFDANFAFMTGELDAFIEAMISAFGGTE